MPDNQSDAKAQLQPHPEADAEAHSQAEAVADTKPVAIPKSVIDAIRTNAAPYSFDAARDRGRAVADTYGYTGRPAQRDAFAHGWAVHATS